MKRIVAALIVVALQVGLLGYMVYERESTLRYGEVVYLRTMPVDPRDPFRGDYVVLNYEINRLPLELVDKSVRDKKGKGGTKVYATLRTDARGVAQVTGVHSDPPSSGLFIRGRLPPRNDWRWNTGQHQIAIEYGVEKLFVPQGKGLEIEQQRGTRNDWQTAMEVAVTVNRAGTAVIRDYRWSDLAVKLEDLTGRPTDPVAARENNPSPLLRVSIRNASDQPIAIVNDDDDCAFTLEAADGHVFSSVFTGCEARMGAVSDITVLQPNEEYSRELNFAQPRWHIRTDTFSGEIGKLDGWQRFRLVYRALPVEPQDGDSDGENVAQRWQGRLSSPAFNNRGRID